MVNNNENIQPELNMVTEEAAAPVAEPQAEPIAEPVAEPAVESETTTTESTEVIPAVESSTPKAEEPVGTYPTGTDSSGGNEMQKQLNASQERIAELEQHRAYSEVQQQAMQYQQQLIQQGYTVEQANTTAQQWLGTRQQQIQSEQNYKQKMEFQEGQYKASLHYGKQFNVDPEVLLKYQTPQAMEVAAKLMSEVRALKDENARLKQGKVPTQNFDTNTAPADASSSEERLLDLYNSGVRNPETEAAARRAAGIG